MSESDNKSYPTPKPIQTPIKPTLVFKARQQARGIATTYSVIKYARNASSYRPIPLATPPSIPCNVSYTNVNKAMYTNPA